MKGLKYLGLIFMAIIVFISTFICLLGYSLEETILDSHFIKDFLRETDFSDQITYDLKVVSTEIITSQLTYENDDLDNDTMEAVNELKRDIILSAYDKSIDTKWIIDQLLYLIEDLLSTVKKGEQEINTLISLKEINNNIVNIILLEIHSLSPDIAEILGADDNDVYILAEELVDSYHIPEFISLREITNDVVTPYFLEDIVYYFQVLRGIYLFYPFITVTIIFMLFFLLTNFTTSLKWLGSTILLSSFTFLIIVVLMKYTAHLFLPDILNTGYIPLTNVVTLATKKAASTVLHVPFLGLGTGFITLIIGLISKGKPNENPLNSSLL